MGKPFTPTLPDASQDRQDQPLDPKGRKEGKEGESWGKCVYIYREGKYRNYVRVLIIVVAVVVRMF